MKLSRSHPFVQAMLRAEGIEKSNNLVTDEVLKIRKEMKEKYPEYFREYLEAKNKLQTARRTPYGETTKRWVGLGPTFEFGTSRSWSRKREKLKLLWMNRKKNIRRP